MHHSNRWKSPSQTIQETWDPKKQIRTLLQYEHHEKIDIQNNSWMVFKTCPHVLISFERLNFVILPQSQLKSLFHFQQMLNGREIDVALR